MAKLRLALYGGTALAGIAWPWYCIFQFIKETEALGLTDPIEIVELFSQGVWANASAGFIDFIKRKFNRIRPAVFGWAHALVAMPLS